MESLLSLFVAAAAIGFSLYAALAAPGLAAYLGLIALPQPLAGIATPAVWGSLLGLLALECLTVRYRVLDLLASALHVLARPLAAALLLSVGLSEAARATAWTAAAAGSGLALIVSFLVLGVRVAARTPAPTPRPGLVTITQPLIAAGLGVLSFSAPEVGVTLSALILIMLAPWAAQLSTLAFSLLRAAASTLHDLGQPRPKWETGVGSLPRALQRAVEAHLGRPLDAVRSARLTLARFGSRWPFYRGRLILASEAPPLFAHRGRLRPQIIPLPPGRGSAANDLLIDILEVEASPPYAFCVGPEAPWGAAILAAISGEEGIGQGESSGGDAEQKHM